MRTLPIDINVIQYYASTADKSKDEFNAFYGEMKELLGYTKRNGQPDYRGFQSKSKSGRSCRSGWKIWTGQTHFKRKYFDSFFDFSTPGSCHSTRIRRQSETK